MKSNNMSKIQISKAKRIRCTPYTSRIEKMGLSSYTVYNKTLLASGFADSLEETYYHLKNYVQIWDVSCQRVIELSGKDSAELTQLMTCRDLSNSKVGELYYSPIIDDQARIINDPVILKLNQEKFWVSIADSDFLLYARGLAIGKNYNVKITELDINTFAIQGKKSSELLEKVFGNSITELKFFNFEYFEFRNAKHLISRSGWSKKTGVEVYSFGNTGLDLFDYLFEIGKEFNLKIGCPHLIERLESGLLSWGNDFDYCENPLEVGLEKFVDLDNDINFLGKNKLIDIKNEGIQKKLMGVKINADKINLFEAIDIDIDGKKVGELRSAVFHPELKCVIGNAMLKKPFFETGTSFNIKIDNVNRTGVLCNIPFF